ncbi:hypothetical protein [Mucilaginibacter glaciei]|uniref:Uncharacterized protein n=1 Tax=Mucilaginibacter glaciei TaxID=2772109 RepID=A0A926P1A5_9SPHI|nr:hypothetical protein [Mucilaginibacter glaciei]MBD1395494.1 hypothetical protein [Mucilaginibacter glaciei]
MCRYANVRMCGFGVRRVVRGAGSGVEGAGVGEAVRCGCGGWGAGGNPGASLRGTKQSPDRQVRFAEPACHGEPADCHGEPVEPHAHEAIFSIWAIIILLILKYCKF